jgi:hypothetical protein
MPKRARLWALLLLAAPAFAPAAPTVVFGLLAGAATEAAAQAARSSGGYSRPSAPRARTPSFGGGGGGWGAAPRTPSVSGGYGRPGSSFGGRGPSSYGSAGDRAYSRQGSASALERYRAQADAARRQREAPVQVPSPPPPTAGATAGRERWGLPPARPRYDYRPDYGRGGYGTDWYRDRGWSPQGGVFGGGLGGGLGGLGGRSFGVWDGLFLGYLLNNLTRAGSVDFFRNHQDDPGLREWREQAERMARDNAELREKLDRLDRELAQRGDDGQQRPRDPNYLPPDVPPEVALVPTAPRNDVRTPTTASPAPAANDNDGGSGGGLWLPLLLVGGAGVAFLSWRRGRQGGGGGVTGAGEAGVKGPIGSAGAMLRHKLSGERYSPSLFRVGMTVAVDPTPFILAGDAIKVPAPVSAGGAGGGERVSIAEVGRVEGGAVDYVRLHLPERRGFFQIHMGADGQPDECRFFAPIDEVSPASEAEWAAWLDPNEGMIGWPEFQTKDGKLYGRAWSPGEARVAPRPLEETVEGVQGAPRTVRSQAMLYAAPTGAPEPAPPVEYILVAAVEAEGQAWIEVNAGIDVNPATLSLA